ncbi:MAG: DegV family protein [Bavariicoccus seileri]|uniref:DegV family protein n=1 Tax=Bavariicoccus seileri TaxID=549685 RepID=UPI0003B41224
MKIALVTDSTAYLTKAQQAAWQVEVVPLSVTFGTTSYKETEIDSVEFYHLLATDKHFPTSSQPAIGELISCFESLDRQGYDAIISIHLSSKISGTYQTVSTIANQWGDDHQSVIYPIDSTVACAVQARLLQYARELIDAGYNAEAIVKRVEQLRHLTDDYFVVNDLSNLQRGGRLTASAAAIGTLLKIKPILTFDDGNIVVFEKIRTEKKAYKRLEKLMKNAFSNEGTYRATIVHANFPEKAKELQDHFSEVFPDVSFSIAYFGPVIGTHLGEKAMAVTWTRVPEEGYLTDFDALGQN